MTAALIIAGFVIVILAFSLKIFREYERGVVFFLGRFQSVQGPGLRLIVPGIQQFQRIDLRIRVHDVPEQDVITRDNVSVKVNAVVYFRVIDAQKSVLQVEDFMAATSQLAQTTLRSVLGQHELDDLLAERDQLNAQIQTILDEQTDAWGVKVNNVELKHVDIEKSMVRAIAKQAEAERGRRAKVIDAEGEAQAAGQFLEAAKILSAKPQALQLRYLTTLQAIGVENSTTIVFPLPLEIIRAFAAADDDAKASS